MKKRERDPEVLAAKLLEAVRKLPPGPVRSDALKEIGRIRAKLHAIARSKADGDKLAKGLRL